MKPFAYTRAGSLAEISQHTGDASAMLIAGGTNLIDLMKLQVETPETLCDISRVGLTDIADTDDGGLTIGALVTNTDTAVHERVRKDYPVLSRAILAGATQQLRNKATTGGNLCQRTRCFYFTNLDQPCNKREPGSGCGAIEGIAKLHAILGTSDQCIATYPGDMAVALTVLGASVEITGADGAERSVPVADFHLLPGDTPWRENVLEDGEVITAVTLPHRWRADRSIARCANARPMPLRWCRSRRSSTWRTGRSRAPISPLAGWRTSRGTIRASANCWWAKRRAQACSTRPPISCSKTRAAMARTTSRSP